MKHITRRVVQQIGGEGTARNKKNGDTFDHYSGESSWIHGKLVNYVGNHVALSPEGADLETSPGTESLYRRSFVERFATHHTRYVVPSPHFRMSNEWFGCLITVPVVVVIVFSHSAHWLPARKKLLYTVANPARGLLNREKKKRKVWQYLYQCGFKSALTLCWHVDT